jgi:hypothetical protein
MQGLSLFLGLDKSEFKQGQHARMLVHLGLCIAFSEDLLVMGKGNHIKTAGNLFLKNRQLSQGIEILGRSVHSKICSNDEKFTLISNMITALARFQIKDLVMLLSHMPKEISGVSTDEILAEIEDMLADIYANAQLNHNGERSVTKLPQPSPHNGSASSLTLK